VPLGPRRNRRARRPRRLRRPPRWLYPRFLERRYAEILEQQVVNKLVAIVRDDVFPQLKRLVFQADQSRPKPVRLDDVAEDVDKLVQSMNVSFGVEAPGVAAGTREEIVALQDISGALSDANRQQWKKIMRETMGVDIFQAEPFLATQKSLFVSQNVGLISKMKTEAVADIKGIIDRGLQGGLRVEEIEKQILAKTGATKSKARLIARDQVAKANAQLTELRQTELGVTRYIWRTSRDERVRGRPGGLWASARPSHWIMEGKTCRWDDATVYQNAEGKWRKRSGLSPKGVALHPGQDYQCRCTAEPILEDVIESFPG
jgi:SPP1 gp7 family putative phage head morphogenesis protein